MNSTSIITQNENIFQTVKTIPFPEVFKVFHNGEMRRRGRYFVVFCPFHSERNPSLVIYDNGFKCFGCSESGDSIKFVSKLYGLQPLEAAKLICERFGIPADTRPLSREDKVRLARAKAEREREKRLQEAFEDWTRLAGQQVRILAEAIRLVFEDKGLDIDDELLPMVHELPRFEWWADILTEGSEAERITLFRDPDFRRWFSCRS